jgi:hypothetical protein
VHTIFETLGGRSLKSELPEDVLRSFRNALLVRIRRSQAQIHKVRATLMHLPSADDEPSELLDVNEILKQALRKLPGRHNTSKVKVKPSLDKQIIPQKYPPTAAKEALDVLIAWRFGLVSEQGENGRFHIRSRLLSQYIEISLWDTGDCPDNDQLQKLYDPLSSIKNNIQSLAWAVYCLENIIGGHIFFHKEADSLFKNRMIILLPLAS